MKFLNYAEIIIEIQFTVFNRVPLVVFTGLDASVYVASKELGLDCNIKILELCFLFCATYFPCLLEN